MFCVNPETPCTCAFGTGTEGAPSPRKVKPEGIPITLAESQTLPPVVILSLILAKDLACCYLGYMMVRSTNDLRAVASKRETSSRAEEKHLENLS